MRIGIDARFYGPRTGGGGLGRYVAELVTHLEELDQMNEYVIFLRQDNFHDCVLKRGNFSKRLVDIPWYSWAEQRQLPVEIKAAKVDLMHFPHWNVPIMNRTPFIVTIHDLILLEDPASARATTHGVLTHAAKYLGFRLVLENAIHRSRHIIAVSETTKRAVLRHFRIRPQKISVIKNGLTPPAQGRSVVLRNLGVVEPYILAIGNHYPHKNLDTLLRAFALVHQARPEVLLVFAGRHDVFTKALQALAHELGLTTAVRFLDCPTDEEIGALYRHAALLAYPSRIEGFGLPPLEAMSVGTPVMASDIPAHREMLGSAASFVDPDAEEDMQAIMMKALNNPGELSALAARGHLQAAQYNWRDTAKQTLDTYLTFGLRRL